jgi:hypothetical protein
VRSGQTERVREVIAALEVIDERSAPPVLHAALTCARPLMAHDDDAEARFIAALDSDPAGYPFLRARTLFSFGRWLRRQRRSADSRAPLRDAVELCDRLGATPWSQSARQELRATGGDNRPAFSRFTRPPHRPRASDCPARCPGALQPTDRRADVPLPQDRRLAPLPGLPKLEITSRGQLRDALAGVAKD